MRRLFVSLAIVLSLQSLNFPIIAAEQRPILLIIDTSGSMKEGKIEGVKKSVSSIIESLRPEQAIGIITFNSKVNLLLKPTVDKKLALSKLDSIYAGGDTSLYDAIIQSIAFDKPSKPSQIVVLSDGIDTTSSSSLANLIKKTSTLGIPVNTIGVNISKEQEIILSTISRSSGGEYFSVEDISKLLDTYSLILEDQLLPSPNVTSSYESNNVKISNSNRSFLFEISSSILTAILVFLILIQLRKRFLRRENQQARLSILQKYSYKEAKKLTSKLRINIKSYNFIPSGIENWIKTKLELIHSDLSYSLVIRLFLISFFALSIFFGLLFQNLIVGALVSFISVPYSFNLYVNSVRKKQINQFSEELPELLNLLSSALKAGLTLSQGLEAFSTDSNGEVARQIRRAISEIRIGTPIEDALMGIADRMQSEDLKWAVTALSIQRVIGGSMATILTTTYETIKSRTEIRREVKTLAAEGKLSAYVLMALPIGIFSFLFLTRREYVSIFWTSGGGIFLALIVIFSLITGWIWMKKIIEIKI